MEWQDVKSSNIAKVRHVHAGMEVQFSNGAVYRYKDVPEEVFDELLKTESVGKFFFAKIKGKFECEKAENKDRASQWDEEEIDTLKKSKTPPLKLNKIRGRLCKHDRDMTDPCEPCGRVNNG